MTRYAIFICLWLVALVAGGLSLIWLPPAVDLLVAIVLCAGVWSLGRILIGGYS